MRAILTLACFSFLLASCATTLPLDQQNTQTNHVVEKNFNIGDTKEVSVGDPIVKAKDYYINTSSQKAWHSDSVVRIHSGIFGTVAAAGDYGIIGRKKLGASAYDLVMISGEPILVDATGRPAKIMNPIQTVGYDVHTTPEGILFTPVRTKSVDTSRGYLNFELIYTGLSNNTIHITYREFSPEDFARTAFFQDLSYDSNQKTIKFRDIEFTILSASNEAIRYIVTRAPSLQ